MERYCGAENGQKGMENGKKLSAGFTAEEVAAELAANDRLVRSEAAKCALAWGRKVDEDVLQEGRIGLWNALVRFDRNRGKKISTYAVPWIRKHVYAELRRQIRHGALFAASLQDPVGGEGEATLADLHADDEAVNPFEATDEEEMLALAQERLEELPAEDREVVEMHFGLRDGMRHTLTEIAKSRGVVVQRIHFRLHRAIRRLRVSAA